MTFWEILLLAFILGIDAFSVALAVGACGNKRSQVFRLSLGFGSFQFMMPIVGWFLGKKVLSLIQGYDHWIAFGLLFIIGVKMIYEAVRHQPEKIKCDRTAGLSLIGLSIATSIDALGAGIGMGILKTSLLYPCTIIGITAGLMTLTGMKLGGIMSSIVGERIEAVAGVVLIILSIKMLTV
ncbi:manganese efflux pump [Candidatus Poribacteria bacterium]|nr:manganese efflux pump [Candidatus Poribacteria bacterium]